MIVTIERAASLLAEQAGDPLKEEIGGLFEAAVMR